MSLYIKTIVIFSMLAFSAIALAQENLNNLDASSTPVLNEELRKLRKDIRSLNGGDFVPSGVIFMWSGTVATIPSGYVLCDGNNGAPDLRDKFIVGATSDDSGIAKTNITGALTQSGGATSHDHGGATGSFTRNYNAFLGASATATGTHDHTISSDVHIPPYFALCFIMKT